MRSYESYLETRELAAAARALVHAGVDVGAMCESVSHAVRKARYMGLDKRAVALHAANEASRHIGGLICEEDGDFDWSSIGPSNAPLGTGRSNPSNAKSRWSAAKKATDKRPWWKKLFGMDKPSASEIHRKNQDLRAGKPRSGWKPGVPGHPVPGVTFGASDRFDDFMNGRLGSDGVPARRSPRRGTPPDNGGREVPQATPVDSGRFRDRGHFLGVIGRGGERLRQGDSQDAKYNSALYHLAELQKLMSVLPGPNGGKMNIRNLVDVANFLHKAKKANAGGTGDKPATVGDPTPRPPEAASTTADRELADPWDPWGRLSNRRRAERGPGSTPVEYPATSPSPGIGHRPVPVPRNTPNADEERAAQQELMALYDKVRREEPRALDFMRVEGDTAVERLASFKKQFERNWESQKRLHGFELGQGS